MDGSSLSIARSSLPQAAADRLRTLIIEGVLAPGARLNERALSEQLGVSRTPLREAFRMLAADGLLVQLPNRGVQVAALSRDDVRHAFEVMAGLEGMAGELAARNVTAGDLAALRVLQRRTGSGDRKLDRHLSSSGVSLETQDEQVASPAVDGEVLHHRAHDIGSRSDLDCAPGQGDGDRGAIRVPKRLDSPTADGLVNQERATASGCSSEADWEGQIHDLLGDRRRTWSRSGVAGSTVP